MPHAWNKPRNHIKLCHLYNLETCSLQHIPFPVTNYTLQQWWSTVCSRIYRIYIRPETVVFKAYTLVAVLIFKILYCTSYGSLISIHCVHSLSVTIKVARMWNHLHTRRIVWIFIIASMTKPTGFRPPQQANWHRDMRSKRMNWSSI